MIRLPMISSVLLPLPPRFGARVVAARLLHALSALILAVPTAAAPDPVRPPTPDEGSVGSSGKFNPQSGEGPSAGQSAKTREEIEADLRKNLKIKELGADRLSIGEVTMDRKSRTVRFRATVNMVEGPVEYLVVTEKGKIHEAVFSTKANPQDIHLAMLLLSVKPAEMKIETDGKLAVPATAAVTATVEWDTNGPPARHPLASMIALAEGAPDQSTGRTLADGPWLYNGSEVDRSGFRAAAEGSVVALIADGAALLNNPGVTRNDDEIHVPNKSLLPRKGMPVTVVFACPAAPAPVPLPQ